MSDLDKKGEKKPRKRSTKKKTTTTSSLSGTNTLEIDSNIENNVESIRQQVFNHINNVELQKSLDFWLKKNLEQEKIQNRDLTILKGMITEYLNSYILFGYDLNNNRIIIQNCMDSKDRDALMEFLKIIFLKQQNENFLDQEGEF